LSRLGEWALADPVYVLEGVEKAYSTRRGGAMALRGISIRLYNGLYVLVGPNGSGKSTLLRVLAGITRPDKGEVAYLGRRFWRDCDDSCIALLRRREIGYLPQNLLVPPYLRVVDIVGMPLWLDGVGDWRARALEALETLGARELADKRAGSLSVGQRQKAAIARALLAGSRVLLLDEPFSHLDEEGVLALVNILISSSRNRLVVVATPSESMALLLKRGANATTLCIRGGRLTECEELGSAYAPAGAL